MEVVWVEIKSTRAEIHQSNLQVVPGSDDEF